MQTTSWFNQQVLLAMNDHTATGNFDGPLSGSFMGIYTNQFTPTPNSQYSDLTLATFAGYAPVALTWGAMLLGSDGLASLVSNLANFRATDGVTPNIGYGLFIIDKTTPNPNLIGVQPFDNPVSFDAAGEGCSIVGKIGYAGSDVGDSDVIV